MVVSENLDDPPAREPPDAERDIEAERPGRNGRHIELFLGAKLHNGPLPILLFNLGQGQIQCALLIVLLCHGDLLNIVGMKKRDYTEAGRGNLAHIVHGFFIATVRLWKPSSLVSRPSTLLRTVSLPNGES